MNLADIMEWATTRESGPMKVIALLVDLQVVTLICKLFARQRRHFKDQSPRRMEPSNGTDGEAGLREVAHSTSSREPRQSQSCNTGVRHLV